jgi:flagellar biogenesis protein FliO
MDFAQQIAFVVIILAGLAALLKIARDRGLARFNLPGRTSSTRRMAVLERLSLTPNHSLHLVTVDGRTVLVGVSPGGCQILEKESKGEAA